MAAPDIGDHFRRCLEDLDVGLIRKLWKHIAPDLPQPKNDFDALTSIHIARTQANSVAIKLRAYSHRWLLDRGFPSNLPDELKPRAERLYPKVTHGVGISVKARSESSRPLAAAVQQAMSDAVADAYAEHQTEPDFVKERMREARHRVLRS